ncbi:hypothetical protein BKA64DRAFT_635125 [Cadophora sp. MPI-SDFR-AT-0126]|nr:hypothetical protein BKA64DRAFT_635125 [Leotiomycetes sp. MPI-SDFR-AT-0126]
MSLSTSDKISLITLILSIPSTIATILGVIISYKSFKQFQAICKYIQEMNLLAVYPLAICSLVRLTWTGSSASQLSRTGTCIRRIKYALDKMKGYGIAPRKPLLPLRKTEGEECMEALKDLFGLEAGLDKVA